MSFGGRGGNATSEGRQQEWVSIATSWGSKFGGPLWKPGRRLCDRMTDGDAVGGLDDGDGADSEKDPITVDLMLMGFGRD